MDTEGKDEGPLKSEAMERENWRGEETILKPEDGGGHTLPASEQDGRMQGDEAKRDSIGTTLTPD